jgi:hypothetical protein
MDIGTEGVESRTHQTESVDLTASDDEKEIVVITSPVEVNNIASIKSPNESVRNSVSFQENSPNRGPSGSIGSDPFLRREESGQSIKDKLSSMRHAAGLKLDAVQQTLGSFVNRKEEYAGTEHNVRQFQRELSNSGQPNARELTLTFHSSNLPFEFSQSTTGSGIIITNTIENNTDSLPDSEKPHDGALILELNDEPISDITLEEFKIRIASLCEINDNAASSSDNISIPNIKFKFKENIHGTNDQRAGFLFGSRVRALANDIHQGGISLIGGIGDLFSQPQNKGPFSNSNNENTARPSGNRMVSGVVGFSKLVNVVVPDADNIPFSLAQQPGGENIIITAIDERAAEQYDSDIGIGATLLSVGGYNVTRKPLHEVLQHMENLTPPITLTFSAPPPIYRAEKAIELASRNQKLAIHMGTWFPMPIMVHHPVNGIMSETRYDGIHDAARRALQFLDNFQAQGIETELKGLETVILPRTFLSGSGAIDGVLRDGSGPFSDLPKGNWQAARIWFTFPSSKQVKVKRTDDSPFGLIPIRDGSDGSWIIVQAEPNGASAQAGISTEQAYILTHVNGVDTCPEIFRSLSPRRPGRATWQLAVLPHFESASECTLTLV